MLSLGVCRHCFHLSYVKWLTNFKGLPLKENMAPSCFNAWTLFYLRSLAALSKQYNRDSASSDVLEVLDHLRSLHQSVSASYRLLIHFCSHVFVKHCMYSGNYFFWRTYTNSIYTIFPLCMNQMLCRNFRTIVLPRDFFFMYIDDLTNSQNLMFWLDFSKSRSDFFSFSKNFFRLNTTEK